MLKILVIGGKRLHIVGWGATIEKALLDWWHWDRDTILADKKRLDSGGQNALNGVVTLGECGWTDVVKAGSRDSWSGLKRFGKLLYWKKKKGCRGAGLKRVNQGLRLTLLRRRNSSAHAEAKHAKRNPKSTTVATFVWFWLLLLSVC